MLVTWIFSLLHCIFLGKKVPNFEMQHWQMFSVRASIKLYCLVKSWPFCKRKIFGSSKLKEFADDNFKFNKNGSKFCKQIKHCGKRRNCNFSLSHGIFKRLKVLTRKNQGLFGKDLRYIFSSANALDYYKSNIQTCVKGLSSCYPTEQNKFYLDLPHKGTWFCFVELMMPTLPL